MAATSLHSDSVARPIDTPLIAHALMSHHLIQLRIPGSSLSLQHMHKVSASYTT